jgi:hypothetical protein
MMPGKSNTIFGLVQQAVGNRSPANDFPNPT